MKFCPKCGSLMMPTKEKGKTVFVCKCGYKDKTQDSTTIKEKVKHKEVLVDVVDEQEKHLPTTKEECPKCANLEAYYWLVQTRAGDEPETKFLKCTKCKHVWREYS